MTEFGRSPLLSVADLEALGYKIALYPVTTLRIAMKAIEEALIELAERGTQRDLIDRLQTRAELYDLLGYEDYETRDRAYFGASGNRPKE